MIKLPEPAIPAGEWGSLNEICGGEHPSYYTESQLKQAVRDALELAFQVAGPEDSYQDEHFKAKADSAMRIRALIKEIDACGK